MTYYIAFFKYEDSKVYMRSMLSENEEDLRKHLEGVDYIDKSTIQIKEIELSDGKKVKIWKLNYGFRTDMQGSASVIKENGTGMEVNIGKVQLMTLVYGIWSSEDLGIAQPRDVEMGLSSDEVSSRLKSVRALTEGGDVLYKEINLLNKEVSGDVEKK
jgi:hypothetical protein